MTIAIKTIALLLSVILSFGAGHGTKPKSASQVLDTQLSKYVAAYNDATGMNCQATSIEFRSKMKDDVVYFDFDGENGYALANQNEILLFCPEGDLPELRTADEIQYSAFDGLSYKTNGETHTIGYSATETTGDCAAKSNQTIDKNTRIAASDCDKYVKTNYGSPYKLAKSNVISGWSYTDQMGVSQYYTKLKNNRIGSEGNCALTSAYEVLKYYAKKLDSSSLKQAAKQSTFWYPSLESEMTAKAKKKNYLPFPAASTVTMSSTTVQNSIGKSCKVTKGSKLGFRSYPTLYMDVRAYAIKNKGYIADDGASCPELKSIIDSVLKKYNCTSLKLTVGEPIMSINKIQSNIDKGRPVIFATGPLNNIYGGAHNTVIVGYRHYEYKVTVLGFSTVVSTVDLIGVSDHHGNDSGKASIVYLDCRNDVLGKLAGSVPPVISAGGAFITFNK